MKCPYCTKKVEEKQQQASVADMMKYGIKNANLLYIISKN